MLWVGDCNFDLLDNTDNNMWGYKTIVECSGYKMLNKINLENATRVTDNTATLLDHACANFLDDKITVKVNDIAFSDHRSLTIEY